MRNVKIVLPTVVLLCISAFSSISYAAEKKPWERTITGKITAIDAKYNLLTVEVEKKEGFLKGAKIIKIPVRVITSYKPTEILINDMPGTIKDIKIGDTVKIDYELSASGGNIAQRIEVKNP